MGPDLATTNALLGVMAAVSVIEALALVGLVASAFVMYRRLMRTLADLEARHVGPVAARVNAILDDVHGVTSTVRKAADSADTGVRWGLAWLFRRVRAGRWAA